MKKEEKRRLDLSSKFMQMGQSLITEGEKDDNLVIIQIGNLLMFIAGLILSEDDDDIFKFADLCSMFSAKKILDAMQNEQYSISDFLNKDLDGETYEELIKKLNNLKDKNKGKNDGDIN